MVQIREFLKDIYYLGVDDRKTTKFENLWALPHGVSYNSYLVKGSKKNALIDTVEISKAGQFLSNLQEIAHVGHIDYLVINHMEPDHSGSIPVIANAYPEAKIVCNKSARLMIEGFYNITDPLRFIEIAEGDTIDLGGLTLQFHMTPMVHWPETIMTYCPEKKVLFSGDAFGTFGALRGGITDTECDTEMFFTEMYRYYACIVAKYNRFVQKAMQKLAGLPIEYICSTHGPVWHEKIAEVLKTVDRLSRGESEKGVTIIYGTMYGNTEHMAQHIANRLSEKGIENVRIHNASYSDMSFMISDAYRYEGLIVGAPTYNGTLFPPVETFMTAMETREIKDKTFAAFESFTWAPAALKTITRHAENLGWPIVDQISVKYAGKESDIANAERLADAIAESLQK